MEATCSSETSVGFQRTTRHHISQDIRVALHNHLLSRWFLYWLIFRPWRWRRHVPLKRRLSFNGLHGVISHKIELFIPTYFTLVSCSAYFLPWRWKRHVPPKRRLALNGLHGSISYKIELFIPSSFHAGFLLGLFYTPKVEATCSSETSVGFERATRRYIPRR
jgi:hypothetical protein